MAQERCFTGNASPEYVSPASGGWLVNVTLVILDDESFLEYCEQIGGAQADTYIRILVKDGVTLAELNEIEEDVLQLLGQTYETEIENRIQDKLNNENMFHGIIAIVSIFCVEALAIAKRPVLITLLITAAAVILFIRASYLGAKKVLGSNLIDSLRDDTGL